MPLTENIRRKLLLGYVAAFYLITAYKLVEGQFLSQFSPTFFQLSGDVFSWLLMQTGLHLWVLQHSWSFFLLDVLFYTAPLFLLTAYFFHRRLVNVAALFMLLVNWLYVQLFVLFPTNSIEGHLAWLLFPVVFIPASRETFYLLVRGLKYFFLFFFFSAGVWKIRQYGIFYVDEMIGILLQQHKELLIHPQKHWYKNFIYWLINHPSVSYLLYLGATTAELFFITGFFTNRFNRLLIIIFVAFLIADYVIMRIPYLEMTPFLLTLMADKKRDITTA